jgi:hypothetical protein
VWVGGQALAVVKQITDVSFGYESAPVVYALDFPDLKGDGAPLTLPSGYKPQANPTGDGVYHDFVLTRPFGSEPAPHPYLVRKAYYSREWVTDPDFQPVKTLAGMRKAIRAGHLQRVEHDGTPYWEELTVVLLLSPAT